MAEDITQPFIGYRSAGRRPESQQDRAAAQEAPLAVLRGFASGVLGAPGDIEAFVRMLPGLNEQTVLPTSEDVERRLPGREISQRSPTGRAFTGAGQITGGFYAGPGSPLRVIGAIPGALRHGAGEFVRATAATTPSRVVKPKGGNWVQNSAASGTPELAVRSLKTRVLGSDPAQRLRDLDAAYAQNVEAGVAVDPDVFARERARLEPEAAINRWLDKKLTSYIRNELGTPEDPVRALAERGVLHVTPGALYNAERTVHPTGEVLEKMAVSDLAKAWENASDYEIRPSTVGDFIKQHSIHGVPEWMLGADRSTPLYSARNSTGSELGFQHLTDELKNAIDPNSGLPRELMLAHSGLDNVTVPQAVERVARINEWRAAEAAAAERAGMMENLQATPRLADEGLNLSFVDKPGGAWVDIPETADPKGLKLCSSIGKAGGWCTKDEWAAKSYGSGNNRLTALVDMEGRPHVQAEITENEWPVAGESFAALPQETKDFYRAIVAEWRKANPDDPDVWKALAEAGIKRPAPDIGELKPPGNTFSSDRAREYAKRDPQYKAKLTDSVLNFLNSGDWGNVADLSHYGIVDLQRDPVMLMAYLRDITKQDSRGAQALFNAAVDANPNAPRFMTTRQLREFIGPIEDAAPSNPPGYAHGGAVMRTEHTGYDAATIDALAAQLSEELNA